LDLEREDKEPGQTAGKVRESAHKGKSHDEASFKKGYMAKEGKDEKSPLVRVRS